MAEVRGELRENAIFKISKTEKSIYGKKFYMLIILLAGIMLLSGCFSQVKNTITPTMLETTPTDSMNGTSTEEFTTPSLTQEIIQPTSTLDPYALDIDKYYNLPISYDYLLEHPEEFVWAPDPTNDPDIFNKWFTEQLMEVIGPRANRQVNVNIGALGISSWGVNAWPSNPVAVKGKLGFFAFFYRGVAVPVIVVNVSRFDPNKVDHTLCIGLFDGPHVPFSGTDMLEVLAKGGKVYQMDIYRVSNPDGISLGDFGGSFVDTTGDTWITAPDNVSFGMGLFFVIEP